MSFRFRVKYRFVEINSKVLYRPVRLCAAGGLSYPPVSGDANTVAKCCQLPETEQRSVCGKVVNSILSVVDLQVRSTHFECVKVPVAFFFPPCFNDELRLQSKTGSDCLLPALDVSISSLVTFLIFDYQALPPPLQTSPTPPNPLTVE